MLIEQGTPLDVDELAQLYDDLIDYLDAHTNYPGWRKGIYPNRQTALEAIREGSLFVARQEGQIVGTIILNHLPERVYSEVEWGIQADDSEILVVRTFGVHPDFMGCGVSKALMRFAETYGRENGIKAIRLDVTVENTPAISLYEKLGYHYLGTVDLGLNLPHIKWFKLYELIL